MARKRKEQLDAETAAESEAAEPDITVEAPGVIEDVDRTTKLTPPEPKREAMQPPPPTAPAEPPPIPKRYLVERGGKIMHRRMSTQLRVGKIVDEREYNIEQIRAQGIILTPVSE